MTGSSPAVTRRSPDRVAVIDVTRPTQAGTIAVGKAPHGMALRPR
jgi:hypothetical protein